MGPQPPLLPDVPPAAAAGAAGGRGPGYSIPQSTKFSEEQP